MNIDTSLGRQVGARELPNLSALSEPYGKLLIAKGVGFALLMGLAAANKRRLGAGGAFSGRESRRK